MAHDNRPKLSTCPICGYTDTADDPEALQMAIEDHIRHAHNLDPATLGGTNTAVKSVTNDTAAEVGGGTTTGATLPIIAAAPNSGGGGTAGAGGPGYGAGAAVLGAGALNDNDSNTRNRRDQ
jgi:hypothetical protein